ncbi:Cytochrome c oxidase subunit 2 precursor [Rickettsiales bacterium Ac37b]|nr:Cytochrome c oxidase subunit 2 precursor [Rickettsiales bacterium Ac37b]
MLAKKIILLLMGCFLPIIAVTNTAVADYPHPWQMWTQRAITPVMEELTKLNDYIHIVIACILIFVSILLAYVCIRFSKKNNPIPSKTSHNTILEIIWTAIPVLILVTIVVPSLKTLYYADRIPDAEMNLKVVAHQWYWEYIYPDNDDLTFMSYMITDDQLKPGQKRLLEVDNRVVVPINTNIKVLITSADVIHSWAIPSFGVKTDAVPGRTNETWMNIKEPGVYYGQCSELCGINHGFMPIVVEAKTKEDYEQWLQQAKTSFSANKFESKYALLAKNY